MSFAIAATVGGAVLGSVASNRAAKAQAGASDRAAQLQQDQFERSVELQEPFRQAGLTGQNRLMELLGIGGDKASEGYGSAMRDFGAADFEADPGYQFRLSEGMKAIDRSASANGRLGSGRTLKDLVRFGQGQASQEYGNAYNRFQTNRSNKINPLQSLAGGAQTATNQVQSAGQSYASGAGDAIMGGGNARASGYVGGANSIGAGIGQGVNIGQNNRLMGLLQRPASSGYGGSGTGYGGFGSGYQYGEQDLGQYL